MELVTLLVGRSMPRSVVVTGGTLLSTSLMCTKPKRNSFTSVGENRCVSVTLKKRACTGVSNGKFRDEELTLLASVLPRDSGRSPPPNGRKLSEFEKKNRAETLSWPPRNSRSQLVVNWSSVYLPGLLMANEFVAGSLLGIKNPLVAPPNWLLLKFSSLRTTGSIAVVAFPKKACEIDACERSTAGSEGMVVLMNVPGESPLRCRVPW